jgi:uncharacterized protein (TIGR00730 family)
MSITITVFGTSHARSGEALYEEARRLGEALARAGYTVANGGYGGIMRATAEGAHRAGGRVIGVTCSAFGRSGPNEFITEEIRTDSLVERLGRLLDLGHGYVVLPGGTGTLLELAQVWELKNKRLGLAGRPIVLLGPFWKPLPDLMDGMDPGCREHLAIAANVEEVMDVLRRSLTVQEGIPQ